jgi:hypothetical protein
MDEFERKYFKQLNSLAKDFQTERRELAFSRIKMFTAALYRRLIDEKEEFDLIVSAGNSGLYMMEITKMLFKELQIELPQTLVLPIHRFEDDGKIINDNLSLKGYIEKQIKHLPPNLNILFIDDEIMMGLTVKAALELLIQTFAEIKELRCVIIAENHFFEWHYNMPKIRINYFSYSRLIQGLNGNIGYFIPKKLFLELISFIPEIKSYNHAMAIVIGGGLKTKDNDETPFYDFTITNRILKKHSDYMHEKNSLIKELNRLVFQGVEEYKNKMITFRF